MCTSPFKTRIQSLVSYAYIYIRVIHCDPLSRVYIVPVVYIDPYNAGIYFRRQNLTSVDVDSDV